MARTGSRRAGAADVGGDRRSILLVAAEVDRLAVLHRRAAGDALRPEGLGEAAAGLLWLLGEQGAGSTMRELARQLDCDPSNVTLLAAQLERSGLAERVPDGRDARRRILRLTARGREVAVRVTAAVATTSPLARLTAAELSRLGTILASVGETS